MRCYRCNAVVTDIITNINGHVYCENCARELGYDKLMRDMFSNPFPIMEELAGGALHLNELDFGNSKLTCPKCGQTLREFERTGKVGCIECYNVFKDEVVKEMLKQQGDSEYIGREPGIKAILSDEPSEAKSEETVVEEEKPKEEKKPEVKEDFLTRLSKADLGTLSDEDLINGMNLAAEREEYKLAARLRDELRSRKGEQ